ncbi:hypothetical protein Patl1_04002 [Pistacia atlantica]|uniref:Uncharacterized protein n=1 Tax=Pistacia atlantica TaxID=434234 RepID=A0ACC1BST0_9ROSI|nr:hypothetical protein Patl1_04002 [Pistacia atlantica]
MEEENVYSLSQSNFTKLSHEKEFGQERLIVESNNFSSLYQSGGVDSVVAALESDLGRGISGHDEDLRRRYEIKFGCRDCQHLDPKGVKDTAGEIMTKATNIIKRQGGRLNLFVEMIALLIFAVRDGLPLGLLISFAYASKKFKRYRGIVQHLPACGTLGFVTTICTDITGDLFLEDAKMADFWIGTEYHWGINIELCQY